MEADNCTKYPYLGNISEIIYLVHHIVQVPLDLRTRGTMWRIICSVFTIVDHILGFKVTGCTYFSGIRKPLIEVEFRPLPGSQPGLSGG